MRLDPDAVIAPEKVRDYLLTPQVESDKAAFSARARYTRANWQLLAHDLRPQMLPLEAEWSRQSVYGDY